MNNLRIWVFRGLVIITICLMVVSWLIPWWSGDIPMLEAEGALIIHPYGLEENLGNVAAYAAEANMPVWFAPVMWVYLGICIAGLLYGSWRVRIDKEVKLGKFRIKLPELLIGVIGFSYIVVAVLAIIVAAIRTGDYGVKLIEIK